MSTKVIDTSKMRLSAQAAITEATQEIDRDRDVNTYKKKEQAQHSIKKAWKQRRYGRTLLNMCDAADAGNLPETLRSIKTWQAVEREITNPDMDVFKPELESDSLRFKIMDLVGTNIPGYFPTPEVLVDDMINRYKGDLQGLRVLEPSAGCGNIADALERRGAKVDVAEWNYTLHEILTEKGYNVVGRDALAIEGQWPLICMNPPFEKLADADHVRYAFEKNLEPGGVLFAIMGEGAFGGSTKKHVAFQEWFRASGGLTKKIEAGAFKESGTNVSSRMVAIQRGA